MSTPSFETPPALVPLQTSERSLKVSVQHKVPPRSALALPVATAAQTAGGGKLRHMRCQARREKGLQRRKVEVPVFPTSGKYTRWHAIGATAHTHTHTGVNTRRCENSLSSGASSPSLAETKACLASGCRPAAVRAPGVTHARQIRR